MNIYEIHEKTPQLLERLTTVWEESVRATHLFLSDTEVMKIKEYVPQAINSVAHLIIAENTSGVPAAFMGVEGGNAWKCCSSHLRSEERDSDVSSLNTGYAASEYGKSPSTSRIRRRSDFTVTWASKRTSARTPTRKEIRIRFYT